MSFKFIILVFLCGRQLLSVIGTMSSGDAEVFQDEESLTKEEGSPGSQEALLKKEDQDEKEEVGVGDEGSKAEDVASGEEKEKDEDVDADGWLDVLGSGRLKKRVVLSAGTSSAESVKPRQGDEVRLAVEVWFQEKKVLERTEVECRVGESEVVQALDLALPLTEVGEKAELLADPDLAYGNL